MFSMGLGDVAWRDKESGEIFVMMPICQITFEEYEDIFGDGDLDMEMFDSLEQFNEKYYQNCATIHDVRRFSTVYSIIDSEKFAIKPF